MEKKEKTNFINFHSNVDEVVKFRCQTTTNRFVAEKEVFKIGDFYYFYVYNRNERTSTYSLRQISKDEFFARKGELLKKRPHKFSEEWGDGKNKYVLRNYFSSSWKRDIPAADCIFFDEDSPLKDIYEAIIAQVELQKKQDEDYDKNKKYEHARKCGTLGVKLGILYENVMSIGPDIGKLKQFKESYKRAIETIKQMPISELRKVQTLLRKGRDSRRSILNKLKVLYFDADVNRLKLDEMQNLIDQRLREYTMSSVKTASSNAVNYDYEERVQIMQNLTNGSRPTKRETLQKLGVDTAAIDFNHYPLSEIKRVLAATLGRELEN